VADLPALAALGAVCAVWMCALAVAKPRLVLYLLFAIVPTQFLFMSVSSFFVSPADVLVLMCVLGLTVRLAALRASSWQALYEHRYLWLMLVAYLAGFAVLGVFSRTIIRLPMAMVVSVVAREQLRTRRHLRRAATALIVAGVIDGAYGLFYIVRGTPLHPTRFQGMETVNFTAMLIMTSAAIALAHLAWVRRPFRLVGPGALAGLAAATLSQMGFIAAIGAWLAVLRRVVTRTNKVLIAAAMLAVLVAAAAVAPIRQRVLNRFEQVEVYGEPRSSADIRWILLQLSWEAFSESPVFGTGYFGFAEYSNRDPGIRRNSAGTGYPTHNSYVEVLVEGGAIAFLLFALHWWQFARLFPRAVGQAARQRDPALAGALVGFPLAMICAVFANVLMVYSFWAVCGMALACLRLVQHEQRLTMASGEGLSGAP